jgi:hypothetical protein
MPSKQGEFCARCGAKCVTRVEKVNGQDKLIFDCPNKHGIQRMEPAPPEFLPEEIPEQTDEAITTERTDDVAQAVDHGAGSHN